MIQDQITKQPKTPRKSISSPNGTVPQILVPKLNLKLVTNAIGEELKSGNQRANGSANTDSSPKKPMYYSMISSPAAHQSSRSPVSSKKKSIARREGHRGLSKLNESTLTLLKSKSKLEEWMEKLKEDANIKDLSKTVAGCKDVSIAPPLDIISDENYEKNYLHRSENRTVKRDLASEVLSLTYSERRRIKMKDIPSSLYLRRKMIPLPPASYEQSSTVSKVKPETEAVCVSLADILKNRSMTSQSESMSPSEVRASVSPINMNRKGEIVHPRSTYRPSPHTEVFSPSPNVKTNPEIENLQKEWQQLIQLADEGLKKGHTENVPNFLLEDLKSPVDKLNIIRESRQKYISRRGLFDPDNSAFSDGDQSENLDEPERWLVSDRDNSFFDRTPSKQNLSLSSYAQRYSVKRHLERYPDDQDCIRRKKIFVNSSKRHKSAPRERTDQPTLQPPSGDVYFSKKLSTNEELRLASFAIDESLTRLKRKRLTLTREEKDARHSLLQNLEDRVRSKSVPRIEINYMPVTQTPNSQPTSNNDDPLPNYSLSFTSSSMQQRMQEFKDRARKKVTDKNLPIPEEQHLNNPNPKQSTGSIDHIPSSVDMSSRIEEIRKVALYRLSKRKKSESFSEEVPPLVSSEEMNTTPRKATRPYLETTQGIIEVVKKRLLSNENMSECITDLVLEGNSSVLHFLMRDETARGIVIDILSEMVLANLVKSEMNEKQKRKSANPKWAHRNENNPLVMPKKKSLIHEDVKEVISNLTSDDFIAASSNGNLVKRLMEHYVNQRNLSEYPSFEESLPL